MKKSVVLYKKLSAPLMARLHEQADVTLIEALDASGLAKLRDALQTAHGLLGAYACMREMATRFIAVDDGAEAMRLRGDCAAAVPRPPAFALPGFAPAGVVPAREASAAAAFAAGASAPAASATR